MQETLHYDPASGALTPLRSKEESHDYRYFPEPDLVPIVPTEQMIERARAALPELPAAKAERYESQFGLPVDTARLLAFRSELGTYFEQALSQSKGVDAKRLADWIVGDLVARIGADLDPADSKVTTQAIGRLAAMVHAKELSGAAAKTVLDHLVAEGGDPEQIVAEQGLGAIADTGQLAELVAAAIAANPAAADQLREGKEKAIGPIIGFVMKETQGRVDGGTITALVRQQLGI